MREYSDADVADSLNATELIDEVERCLIDLGTGRASQLPKAVMPIGSGAFFLSVAGMVPRLGLATAKWGSYLPGEPGRAGVSTSTIVVSDLGTGSPRGIVTGMLATHRRTAATALVLLRRLLTSTSRSIVFVGFGPTNRAVFDLLIAVGWPVGRLVVAVRSAESAARLAEDAVLGRLLSEGRATIATDVAAAIAGADIVISATGSTAPLGRVGDLAIGGAVISLDGSRTWLTDGSTRVLTDRPGENGTAPEVAIALSSPDPIGRADQRSLFDIAGSAVTDVALAALLIAGSGS
ncbi:MAG TPA: hypothetical protein VGC18_09135 [Lacisediminihabitans sp.]|uniref:hypothetical protein n=1 Tax=Lacisediminihabitans sp. TaxID=2787631 RepID=UPI002ED7E0E2